MTELPSYDELPEAPAGGRLAWHVFGEDDQLGLINLLTEDRVAEAAKLIKRGQVFSLDHPFGTYKPALNLKRGNPDQHLLSGREGLTFDDYYDGFFPQGGSQIDSLAHVGHLPGQFYNGATNEQIEAGERNGIDHWARHGMAGRAVVLDMPGTFAALGREYDPSARIAYTVDDLKAAAKHSGIEHRTGDIVLLYTGFESWYADQPQDARDALPDNLITPGIEQSEDMARYLWNLHVAMIASDNYAVEAWPAVFGKEAAPFGFLHQMLIGSFGMAIGELWHLADVVADCRETGDYEGMLITAPMMAPGGIGSTANALFVR